MEKYKWHDMLLMFVLFPVILAIDIVLVTVGFLWHCFATVFNWVWDDKVLRG